MNETGIVRKIDELGRIVIPKEIRKYLNINSNDDFQIFLSGNKIVLQKYRKIDNFIDIIIKYLNSVSSVTNYYIDLIIDNKLVISNEIVSDYINSIIKERRTYIEKTNKEYKFNNKELFGKLVIIPIIYNSDYIGNVFIIGNDLEKELIDIGKIVVNIVKNLLGNN